MMEIKSSKLFAKVYNDAFKSIMNADKNRWTFTGGRASTKSSFISLNIILLMLINPSYNAVIVRKYANTLRQTVFEQIVWAINFLGVRDMFKITKSLTTAYPITLQRADGTAQIIRFIGLDDPEKQKSLKVSCGYNAILWAEEKTEFTPVELNSLKLSVLRSSISEIDQEVTEDKFYMFESYNPPSAIKHWCNEEVKKHDSMRMVLHTTYLDIDPSWLGSAILHEIEQMKEHNQKGYENVFLGKATGTGRNVFENLEIREITDEEISNFDITLQGIDWGYFPDPYAYGCMALKNNKLYILDELYLWKSSNINSFEKTAKKMKDFGLNIELHRTTADNTKKDVNDFRAYGADTRSALKGPGSKDAGCKWLQSLHAIVIDPKRTPRALDEFSLYEYDMDRKSGEIMEGYPEGQPDHFIALTRYATEHVWRRAGE